MSPADLFDLFWKLCAVATPFVVLAFNLRAITKTNERKALMESIDGKINAAVVQVNSLAQKSDAAHAELNKKIDASTSACRDNIEGIATQVRAFQLDVVQRYPTRLEFREKAEELRDEFRHYGVRGGLGRPNSTREGEGG